MLCPRQAVCADVPRDDRDGVAEPCADDVKFDAKVCTKWVSWSATRIKVKVPAKAKSDRIKVEVTTAVGTSNGKSFKVKR